MAMASIGEGSCGFYQWYAFRPEAVRRDCERSSRSRVQFDDGGEELEGYCLRFCLNKEIKHWIFPHTKRELQQCVPVS